MGRSDGAVYYTTDYRLQTTDYKNFIIYLRDIIIIRVPGTSIYYYYKKSTSSKI